MKNKILQEFLDSNIKIISKEKLEQCIEYCIYKNQENSITGKTSYHHILPRKLFPEYSNLNENPWNGVHLLHSDHYYVHWLLTEAIDSYSMLNAFCSMHNKDTKNGRIEEKDLIPADEFQKKMEERSRRYTIWYKENIKKMRILNRKHSEFMKKEILIGGKRQSISQYYANIRSIKEQNTFIDGKSLLELRIEKIVKARKMNGWDTSKHQKAMKKVEENGKTKQQNTTDKMVNTRKNKKVFV
jgi:hypothetical protein